MKRASRALGWACVLAGTTVATLSPRLTRADDASAPSWLGDAFTRGPLAATTAIDDRHPWWRVDGTLPLGLDPSRAASRLDRAPAFGLGLSVAGGDAAGGKGLRYSALLDRRASRTGQWLGLSIGGSDDAGGRHLGTGLWRSVQPFQLEAGVVTSLVPTREQGVEHWGFYRNTRDSLRWVDTTSFRAIDRTALNANAQSALRWQLGRVEVSAVGGVMLSSIRSPLRWAQAAVQVQATRQIMVMAALGQRPAPSLAFDPFAGPRTMLGVRVAPWAGREDGMTRPVVPHVREWVAHSRPEGRTSVRVRCTGARRVELTGDFTEWTPVMLIALGGGWWGSELPIAPGLHQVQVRIDGGPWQVPPGLPTTEGDFVGRAGVLLME